MFSMNATGMDGAMIQMVNHGVTTGALFACVGVIYERYHTREMAELGGLWDRLPLLAFFFILSSLGSAAVPGLNGFVGEFPILAGDVRPQPEGRRARRHRDDPGGVVLLWMLQRVIFGPLREPHGHDPHGPSAGPHPGAGIRPVGWHEIAGLSLLMVLIVVIGVYPRPFFDRIRPAVAPIAARFPAPDRDGRGPRRSSPGRRSARCPRARLAGPPIGTPGVRRTALGSKFSTPRKVSVDDVPQSHTKSPGRPW